MHKWRLCGVEKCHAQGREVKQASMWMPWPPSRCWTLAFLRIKKAYEYLVSSGITQRIFFFQKIQGKYQINTINIWPFSEWTACPFPHLEALKIKTHILYSTVIDEAQDAYPEPEKGHAGQASVSLEFLMF